MNQTKFSKQTSKIQLFSHSLIRVTFLSIVLFFTGCTVSLAPRYDQNIVDRLSASSTEVYQLLSEVSGGTTKNDFDQRNDKYNKVLGELEALKLQINARPIPNNRVVAKVTDKVNSSLQKKGTAAIGVSDKAPSAIAIENIIANIAKMKETDKSEGITPIAAKLFKGNIDISFDQALTYERYLNS